MKKIFFMAAVAALALSSCSSTEEVLNAPEQVAENAISFDIYTGRTVSRAASEQDINLEWLKDNAANKAHGFGVFAFETGNIAFNNYVANKSFPNFMYNENVYFNTDWKYDVTKYWPNDGGMVTFQAYAPWNVQVLVGKDGTNEPVYKDLQVGKNAIFSSEYNGVGIRYNATENYDLLWGTTNKTNADGDYVGENCIMDQTKPVTTAKTQFVFKHALAQLGFNVTYFVEGAAHADGAAVVGDPAMHDDSKIVVKSIRLVGPTPTQGVLSLYDGTWTVEQAQEGVYVFDEFKDTAIPANSTSVLLKGHQHEDWENAGNPGCYADADAFAAHTPNCGYEELDECKQLVTDKKLVIPSENEFEIEIVYDVISGTGANKSVVTNKIRSGNVNYYAGNHPLKFTLESNKSYTVNIHLGLTAAKFDVLAVDNWATGAESLGDVDLPANK